MFCKMLHILFTELRGRPLVEQAGKVNLDLFKLYLMEKTIQVWRLLKKHRNRETREKLKAWNKEKKRK